MAVGLIRCMQLIECNGCKQKPGKFLVSHPQHLAQKRRKKKGSVFSLSIKLEFLFIHINLPKYMNAERFYNQYHSAWLQRQRKPPTFLL